MGLERWLGGAEHCLLLWEQRSIPCPHMAAHNHQQLQFQNIWSLLPASMGTRHTTDLYAGKPPVYIRKKYSFLRTCEVTIIPFLDEKTKID